MAEPEGVDLVFPSDSAYLSLVRKVVEWFVERCDLCSTDCGRVVLSAVEATTNIIRHAYASVPGQRITLRLRCVGDGLEVEFLDDGANTAAGGLQEAHRELLEPGGLGVHMMKSCMDDLQYEVRPEGGARLILRKRLGTPAPPEGDDSNEKDGEHS